MHYHSVIQWNSVRDTGKKRGSFYVLVKIIFKIMKICFLYEKDLKKIHKKLITLEYFEETRWVLGFMDETDFMLYFVPMSITYLKNKILI